MRQTVKIHSYMEMDRGIIKMKLTKETLRRAIEEIRNNPYPNQHEDYLLQKEMVDLIEAGQKKSEDLRKELARQQRISGE